MKMRRLWWIRGSFPWKYFRWKIQKVVIPCENKLFFVDLLAVPILQCNNYNFKEEVVFRWFNAAHWRWLNQKKDSTIQDLRFSHQSINLLIFQFFSFQTKIFKCMWKKCGAIFTTDQQVKSHVRNDHLGWVDAVNCKTSFQIYDLCVVDALAAGRPWLYH